MINHIYDEVRERSRTLILLSLTESIVPLPVNGDWLYLIPKGIIWSNWVHSRQPLTWFLITSPLSISMLPSWYGTEHSDSLLMGKQWQRRLVSLPRLRFKKKSDSVFLTLIACFVESHLVYYEPCGQTQRPKKWQSPLASNKKPRPLVIGPGRNNLTKTVWLSLDVSFPHWALR